MALVEPDCFKGLSHEDQLQQIFEALSDIVAGGGSGGAPTNATYITQTPNGTLTNEQALSGLATGVAFVTTGTGAISTQDWLDQSVKTTANVTFNSVNAIIGVPGGGSGTFTIGGNEATFDTDVNIVHLPGLKLRTNSYSANQTIGAQQCVIFADTSLGTWTLTLPDASAETGTVFRIKRTDTSANDLTINTSGSEPVEGVTNYPLSGTDRPAIDLISDGTGWWIF